MPGATSKIPSLRHEIWHFLSDLYWLSQSTPPIFSRYSHFFESQSPLHRLVFGTADLASLETFPDDMKKDMFSLPCLMCLLWVLSIFVEHAYSPPQLFGELQELQERLRRQKLDRRGSPLLLFWALLKKEDSGELHPRSWATVRFLSVIKVWSGEKQQALATLLHGYLLSCEPAEAQRRRYYLVMEGLMEEPGTADPNFEDVST